MPLDCVYCGYPADTDDHIVPVSYKYAGKRTTTQFPGETVAACIDCNRELGAQLLFTVKLRKNYIAQYLKNKLGRLHLVEWTDEELEELGPNLKASILQVNAEYKKLRKRYLHATGKKS